jgi:hypothetical protein
MHASHLPYTLYYVRVLKVLRLGYLGRMCMMQEGLNGFDQDAVKRDESCQSVSGLVSRQFIQFFVC